MKFSSSPFTVLLLCASFTLSACDDESTSPPGQPAPPLCGEEEAQTTPSGVEFVRTSDACFESLPDWPYPPRYVDIDGLQQGYVDEGPAEGQVILLLHGQPTWSYLYRFMIPSLVNAGYRDIAMDHIGFGRSDKPTDLDYHSFENHAQRLVAFMDVLELSDITLFCQDWGSIIGLYVAADDLGRFKRMIVGNGGLPVVTKTTPLPTDIEAAVAAFGETIALVPEQQPPFFDANGEPLIPVAEGGDDLFGQWMAYALHAEDFRASTMTEALTYFPITAEEEQAYDAPFPTRASMAGPRMFPSLRNELVGITESRLASLQTYERPFLTIFGGNDPGLSGDGDGQEWMKTKIPGAANQPHTRLPDASHFLQDDRGPEIAAAIIEFIEANP